MQSQKRRKRFQRDRNESARLTARDFEILRIVQSYRFIQTPELHALIGGSLQRLQRRLRKLFDVGYLSRPPSQRLLKEALNKNFPMVYALGDQLRRDVRDGLRVAEDLEERGIDFALIGRQDWTSKNRVVRFPYMAHALMVTKFRVCLELACQEDSGIELLYWYGDRQVKDKVIYKTERGRVPLPIHPDGFFCLQIDGEKKWFFLEADRHTEPQRRSTFKKTSVYNKVLGYQEFWRQRRYKNKESPLKAFEMTNFRALFVTMSEKRADNLRLMIKEMDPKSRGLNLFMATSQDNYDIKKPIALFDGIWMAPSDSLDRFGLG